MLTLFATDGGPKQQPMYRYSVDRAVTYTSEDIVLFRESPFACWMERLTLENPDHGIEPDADVPPPVGYVQRQDDFAATLRDEGKNVALIDWDAEESIRRNATLEAMRRGTDFIVNGQLALGPLSGPVNLLMRTSGYSQLGSFLYIPCDTQAKTTLNSAFRLCFIADLLHSLQGQLPPQMLIIRGDADLLPLQTEDNIYHYRAVKQRFMRSMSEFRKHRMPDPAESSHFGRWSACAHAVLKRRALQEEQGLELAAPAEQEFVAAELAVPQTAASQETAPPEAAPPEAAPQPAAAQHMSTMAAAPPLQSGTAQPRIEGRGIPVGDTLVAQARKLKKKVVHEPPNQPDKNSGEVLDAALENLEFIGSSGREPSIGGTETSRPAPQRRSAEAKKPAAAVSRPVAPRPAARPAQAVPVSPPPAVERTAAAASAAQLATPAATLNTDSREFEVDCIDDSDYRLPAGSDRAPMTPTTPPAPRKPAGDGLKLTRPFSSSLNTSNIPDE